MERKSPSSRRAWIEISGKGYVNPIAYVALLAEGVDRNASVRKRPRAARSLSSRRAWIEMQIQAEKEAEKAVALLAEGVDRNAKGAGIPLRTVQSPSSRRAWIEIFLPRNRSGRS